MAQINFPVATVAGQTFEADTGVIYTYVGTPPNGYWSGTFGSDGTDTLDARYIKKEDGGVSQTIKSSGLTINNNNLDTIVLNGNGNISAAGTINTTGDQSYYYVNRTGSSGSAALYLGFADGNQKFKVGIDGSASFDGSVEFGDPFSSTPADKKGVHAFNQGALNIYHYDRNSLTCLKIVNTEIGNEVFTVSGGGSATFGGDVVIGNDPVSGTLAGIKCYGNAGSISVTGNSDGQNLLLGYTQGNATNTVAITASGNATFAGDVTANKFIGDGSGLTNVPSSGAGDLQSVTDAGNTTTNGATFAGGLTQILSSGNQQWGGNGYDGTQGAYVSKGGTFYVTPATGTEAFLAYNEGSSTPTVTITGAGAATFAGGITSGGDQVLETGSLNVYQSSNSGSTPVFNGGWNTGSGRNITSTIFSNGSAEFAGDITAKAVDVTLPISGYTYIGRKADGTATFYVDDVGAATFAGALLNGSTSNYVGTYVGTSTGTDLYGVSNNTEKWRIKGDGSATFAGSVNTSVLRIVASDTTYPRIIGTPDGTFYSESSAGVTPWILNPSGSATFAGQVKCQDTSGGAQLVIGTLNSAIYATDSIYLQPGGTTAVTLASSGYATFASGIKCSDGLDVGNPSTTAYKQGFLAVPSTSGGSYFQVYGKNGDINKAFSVYNGDTIGITASIDSTGAATFAGGAFAIESNGNISTNIRSQGNIELDSTGAFTSPKIKLYAVTGNATFGGTVTGNINNAAIIGGIFKSNSADDAIPAIQARNFDDGGDVIQGRKSDGSITSSIKAAGDATFAGTVTAGGFDIDALPALA